VQHEVEEELLRDRIREDPGDGPSAAALLNLLLSHRRIAPTAVLEAALGFYLGQSEPAPRAVAYITGELLRRGGQAQADSAITVLRRWWETNPNDETATALMTAADLTGSEAVQEEVLRWRLGQDAFHGETAASLVNLLSRRGDSPDLRLCETALKYHLASVEGVPSALTFLCREIERSGQVAPRAEVAARLLEWAQDPARRDEALIALYRLGIDAAEKDSPASPLSPREDTRPNYLRFRSELQSLPKADPLLNTYLELRAPPLRPSGREQPITTRG
jgi:hypothetical protein